jgi:predicted outer membrane repeat protein
MLIAIIASSLAMGSTLTVGPGGDYTTISDAINASIDGDRIEVSAGTYLEPIRFDGKDIAVIGVDGSSSTTIESLATTVVEIGAYATSETVFSGFTVSGAGQRCVDVMGGTPRLENLLIESCGGSSIANGGGMLISAGNPSLTNVAFNANLAASGGGLSCNSASATLTDTTFDGNRATTGRGGAIISTECDLIIGNAIISGNEAIAGGGGIAGTGGTLNLSDGTVLDGNRVNFGPGGGIQMIDATSVIMADVVFEENVSRDFGGGASFMWADSVTIENARFTDNRATSGESSGGAIGLQSSTIAISSTQVNGNEAGACGGGIAAEQTELSVDGLALDANRTNGTGGGICIRDGELFMDNSSIEWNNGLSGGGGLYTVDTVAFVQRTELEWNDANGGYGGGLLSTDSTVWLDSTSWRANGAQFGGAASSDGSGSFDVFQSVFQENEALFGAGGIFVSDEVLATVWSNDFLGNQTATSDSPAQLHLATAVSDVRNNIIALGMNGVGVSVLGADDAGLLLRHNNTWGNEGGNYAGMDDPTGTDGNLSSDPLLVDLSLDRDFDNDDLYLRPMSPCIDAADPDTFDADAPLRDIGAFGLTDIPSIDEDGDGYPPDAGGDCDDGDPTIHPDTDELCDDGVDNNCDGLIDEGCSGDTGLHDTGLDDSGLQDTGSEEAEDSGSSDAETDREGSGTTPATATDDLYEIKGEGCRCSSQTGTLKGLFGLWLPFLIVLRRRQS